MPFSARCPKCKRTSSLAASEAGRNVRCSNCGTMFITQESWPVAESVPDDLADIPTIEAAPSAVARPSDSGSSANTTPRLEKVGASMVGASVLLILSLLTAAGVIYGLVSVLQQPAPAVPAPPPPARVLDAELPAEIAGVVAQARELNHGEVPEELKRMLPLFKDKNAAAFPPPPPNPAADPTDLDHALALTRDPLWIRRKTAAAWLAREPVNPARQAEVNQALLAMLRNPETLQHQAAADGLFVWADMAARTELVELAQQERQRGARTALMLLARMKDERAAPIAALQLSHFLKRTHASRVLETLGSVAEKDVAVYLGDEDKPTRLAACRVLEHIGTAASLPALEAAVRNNAELAEPGRGAIKAIKMRVEQ